jgi:hypothetical protein
MGAKGACGVIDRTDCVPCMHAAISRFTRRVGNRQAVGELAFYSFASSYSHSTILSSSKFPREPWKWSELHRSRVGGGR